VAVATPVLLVVVSAGHSKTTLGGQLSDGRVVSRTVIFWTQLATFPQASVAVHVLLIILVTPQVFVTMSLYRMMTWPQVSWAVAMPVALVLVSAGHSRTRSGGQVKDGFVVSRTVMV
jgi:hypothetical protein